MSNRESKTLSLEQAATAICQLPIADIKNLQVT